MVAIASLFSSANAQRVPDSSVTGTARAAVGINPASIPTAGDTGDTAIASAYDPSWTVLVGNATQTKLPRKLCNNGDAYCISIDASGIVTARIYWPAYCTDERCYPATYSYYSAGPATGSQTLQIARSYSGATLTVSPVITIDGKLVGWSYSDSVFTGAYHSSSYSNPSLVQFVGPQQTQWYCYGTAGGPCGGMSSMRGNWTAN